MINDLDQTIETLLKRELPPNLADQITISFAPPDGEFPPSSVSLPAIDLFLYDIRENKDLRSIFWDFERNANGKGKKKRDPVRVDFSYFITAWPSESVPTPVHDEHWLLGETMKILLRHEIFPEEILQGTLIGQKPSIPVLSLQPSHLQSIGEFWQALGGKPKAALNYTVTLSIDPFQATEVPLVLEKIIGMKPGME
ncbi:MAG: DUF4255 domain-containing protein [Nitrospira sp.]|nr:DUF4255 domain-containing protein [Nitrospira sp.]MCA9456676.1 DUF4255 domain-containing protein [Nitrospira sp.]MCW5783310.1 DUF4255 domain-containing protein [Nitrospirales bacterium]